MQCFPVHEKEYGETCSEFLRDTGLGRNCGKCCEWSIPIPPCIDMDRKGIPMPQSREYPVMSCDVIGRHLVVYFLVWQSIDFHRIMSIVRMSTRRSNKVPKGRINNMQCPKMFWNVRVQVNGVITCHLRSLFRRYTKTLLRYSAIMCCFNANICKFDGRMSIRAHDPLCHLWFFAHWHL